MRRRRSSPRASASPAICSKPPRATSSSATAPSPSPAPTARSASSSWRGARARRSDLPGRRARRRSTTPASAPPTRTPSPTAATFARSRSIPTPAPRRSARYTVADDFGRIVNPLIVEGQIHGGIVQGIGQALMEEARLRPGERPAPVRLAHGLRAAARRTTCRRSRSPSTRCRARPTCSASRARARRARSDRSPRR